MNKRARVSLFTNAILNFKWKLSDSDDVVSISISCSSSGIIRCSCLIFAAVNDCTDAQPARATTEKNCQEKSKDDVTDKLCKLIERLGASLTAMSDVIDFTCDFKFDRCVVRRTQRLVFVLCINKSKESCEKHWQWHQNPRKYFKINENYTNSLNISPHKHFNRYQCPLLMSKLSTLKSNYRFSPSKLASVTWANCIFFRFDKVFPWLDA